MRFLLAEAFCVVCFPGASMNKVFSGQETQVRSRGFTLVERLVVMGTTWYSAHPRRPAPGGLTPDGSPDELRSPKVPVPTAKIYEPHSPAA